MRPNINYKKNTAKKHTNTWRLNNQQVTREIKREIKKFLEKKMTMKTQQLKTYGVQQKQF